MGKHDEYWLDRNRKVRRSIRSKIAAGHQIVNKKMGNEWFIALDHGKGKASSSFIPVQPEAWET